MEKKDFFVISIIDNYVKDLSGNWISIFIIGLLLIAFSLVFFIFPNETLVFIVYILGTMLFFVGLGVLGMAMKVKRIESNYEKIKKNIEKKFFE
ncbi:MAG: DUF308 domain-containing protein [Candidatus Pacebacteria bacterium]|jgi:uncharacterized membrane protein HdeD (DUF308 family)|nr:DUF308 domain-containing protein [Candidatus Paceibacterota bacterium]MDD5012917.1 DUF308 domain-containing protein [Candidatus Paceibacterota bacterium]MDD5752501.1 DUF308 domain-containing protein [Candidatus Paceibacterota bacterium]